MHNEMPSQSTTKQFSDEYEDFFTQHGFSYVVSLQKEGIARPWGADIYKSDYLSVAHMYQAYEGSWFLVAPHQAPVEAFTATGPGFPWKSLSFAWEDYSKPFVQLAKQYEYPEEPPAEAWTALEKRQLSIFFELVKTARIQI